MEKWERNEIDRRFKRLEEETCKSDDRIRAIEWRDGTRVHLTYGVLIWAMLAVLVVFEIVVAVRG